MGINCCKYSGDLSEKKFSTTKRNRIKTNNINKKNTDDKIKMNITDNNEQTINMIIEHNLSFSELKKQYCELIYKKIRINWLFYPKEKS